MDLVVVERPRAVPALAGDRLDLVVINRPRVRPHNVGYQICKRVLDLALCLIALPFLLPVLAACALAIRLDSPGPVLFVQERIGKGGRTFRMYKFRTMQHNLDDSQHRAFMAAFVKGQVGGADDGRSVHKPIQPAQITRVGRLLRKASLDELPQLINVLKGEMSLVGPRPNVPWETEAYYLWHHERLEVLPGITGLAQVRGRSSLSFSSIVKNDIEYVEKQSLELDLKIIYWTILSVFNGRGAS